MDLRLLLTPEGAEYLREWSDSMTIAMDNITTSTDKLLSEYESVAEYVGPHRDQFLKMLLCIRKSQQNSKQSLSFLCAGLKNVAKKIDDFNTSTSDESTDHHIKKLSLHL